MAEINRKYSIKDPKTQQEAPIWSYNKVPRLFSDQR